MSTSSKISRLSELSIQRFAATRRASVRSLKLAFWRICKSSAGSGDRTSSFRRRALRNSSPIARRTSSKLSESSTVIPCLWATAAKLDRNLYPGSGHIMDNSQMASWRSRRDVTLRPPPPRSPPLRIDQPASECSRNARDEQILGAQRF